MKLPWSKKPAVIAGTDLKAEKLNIFLSCYSVDMEEPTGCFEFAIRHLSAKTPKEMQAKLAVHLKYGMGNRRIEITPLGNEELCACCQKTIGSNKIKPCKFFVWSLQVEAIAGARKHHFNTKAFCSGHCADAFLKKHASPASLLAELGMPIYDSDATSMSIIG